MQNHFDGLSGFGELNSLIDFIQRKNVGDELFSWKARRDRQLVSSLGLAVGGTEMAFNPDVVVMNQVAVQLGHGALWHAAEEDDQSAFFYHMNALGLGSVGGGG